MIFFRLYRQIPWVPIFSKNMLHFWIHETDFKAERGCQYFRLQCREPRTKREPWILSNLGSLVCRSLGECSDQEVAGTATACGTGEEGLQFARVIRNALRKEGIIWEFVSQKGGWNSPHSPFPKVLKHVLHMGGGDIWSIWTLTDAMGPPVSDITQNTLATGLSWRWGMGVGG